MFMSIDRSYLLADLRRLACEVAFSKATDGQTRVMRCTLNPAYMPEGTNLPVQPDPQSNQIVVWDLDKSDWRSFLTTRVYTVQQVNTV